MKINPTKVTVLELVVFVALLELEYFCIDYSVKSYRDGKLLVALLVVLVGASFCVMYPVISHYYEYGVYVNLAELGPDVPPDDRTFRAIVRDAERCMDQAGKTVAAVLGVELAE